MTRLWKHDGTLVFFSSRQVEIFACPFNLVADSSQMEESFKYSLKMWQDKLAGLKYSARLTPAVFLKDTCVNAEIFNKKVKTMQ